jgi:RNA methyltransferase, TrmH family
MKPKIISSVDNAKIKQLKRLRLKKYRKDMAQFVVENLAIIYDGVKDGYIFDDLLLTEEFEEKNRTKLKIIADKAKAKHYYQIDYRVNKSFTQVESPVGIAATYSYKEQKIETNKSVVYLNGINDPGNLGTIFRTALAFGFNNIVIDEKCVDIYNGKVINAAKDSIFKLNIIEDKDGEWLKSTKLPIYTTSSHKGELLSGFKAAEKFCLVLGNESNGVDKDIMKLAKDSIKIDMNKDIESLNVASAAAVLLYELSK